MAEVDPSRLSPALSANAVAPTADDAPWWEAHPFLCFWVLTVKSFVRNRVPVRASALAYSSLLALVPMLALVMTMAFSFLSGDEGQKHIHEFIHYVVHAVVPSAEDSDDAEKTIAEIQTFVKNQRTSAVSTSAALMLAFIAIMMLARIEDTFNDIWGVTRGRNWFVRVTQYWAVLTLGPVLLLLVIGLTSSAELAGLTEKLAETSMGVGTLSSLGFKLLPYVLLTVGFTAFYALLPATKVQWKAAFVGGLVGGTLWQLNSLLSVLYVSRVVSNNKIYGSLGMVPVVMLGLYFSWLILLFGAQVSYSFQNRHAELQERRLEQLDQRTREFVGLRLMVAVARRFQANEPPFTGTALARELGVPTRLTTWLVQTLVRERLLAENNSGEAAYLPARPLEQISCHDVLLALRTNRANTLAAAAGTAPAPVEAAYAQCEAAERDVAGGLTLARLATESGLGSAEARS